MIRRAERVAGNVGPAGTGGAGYRAVVTSEPSSIETPGVWQWLRYAYGRRLPDRHRAWVLHDVSCPTWLLRFAARILVQAAPWLIIGFVALALFVPAPIELVYLALLLGVLMSLYLTMTSAGEFVEAKVVQHGFPPGSAAAARKARRSGH